MANHRLKVWSQYWNALVRGDKTFEVRRDDRGFQAGDTLTLCKVAPLTHPDAPCDHSRTLSETGETTERTITYILTGGQFGIEPGYVVLGLRK